jgi:hypothetical protein
VGAEDVIGIYSFLKGLLPQVRILHDTRKESLKKKKKWIIKNILNM